MPYPDIKIEKLNPKIGGMAHIYSRPRTISIALWIMADKNEAMGTIRHELAHLIVYWLHLKIKIYHGKEFHQILRQIAPDTWRNDLHWHDTPAISKAKEKEGGLTKKKHVWKVHTYGCTNPECKRKPAWSYKRVPHYVKQGLAICPSCNKQMITEIK